jgi:macrodomain Ter protein organizer (MatP/YcbG family)
MNEEMQQILVDIFPLIVEVNFNTEYRANIDIQPCFDSDYQVWYRLGKYEHRYIHSKTAFWNDELNSRKRSIKTDFKQRMAEFKKELLKILGRD